MASSSTGDLEKAAAPSLDTTAASGIAWTGSNNEKDCEGWAAGQDALATACSRTSVHARAEEEGHHTRGDEDEDDSSHDHDHEGGDGGGGSIVGRVLSRITSKSSVELGPPPDGGWVAWTQCKSPCLYHHPRRPPT